MSQRVVVLTDKETGARLLPLRDSGERFDASQSLMPPISSAWGILNGLMRSRLLSPT